MKLKLKFRPERVIDQEATARAARSFRRTSGVSLSATAREIGCSVSHLSMMENGSRSWTTKSHADYAAAVEKLKGEL